MKGKNNKKEISFLKKNIYLLMMCFLLLSLSTIGYSALNQKLYISGDLALRAVKDIRISDLKLVSSNNGGYEIYNNKFTSNTISAFTILPEKDSSIVYRSTITNYGTENMIIDSINLSTSSSTISYNISDIEEGTIIEGGTSITFDITLTKNITPFTSSEVDSILLEITFKEPTPIYKDAVLAGNDPNLLNDSLTPVVYDETKSAWVVADPTTEWYNYSKQEWANAVILNSGVTKNVGDTLSLDTDSNSNPTDVKAMYVWIPRYEYKITGTYGTHLDGTAGTQSLPGQIEVKFIPRTQTTADTDYILHPAFTWDDNSDSTITTDEHISGIWVGKFDPNSSVADGCTGDDCACNILPNSSSKVGLNIYRQFEWATRYKSLLKDAIDVDAHMMKNSEWGAVAYLSQSIYGKYGNTLYSDANKRIYKNNSSNFVTGASSGKIPATGYTSSGTCKYDDIADRGNGTGSCGGGASTTGNITGVYDMVGPVYTNVSARWSSSSEYYKMKYDSKYYDSYSSDDSTTACNGGICYGHALSETSGFYYAGSNTKFVTDSQPWIRRNLRYNSGSASRIFQHSHASGDENSYVSFKSVILMPGM